MTFSFSRTFTEAEVGSFGDLTRDYNPVHYDERFAAVKGFPKLICHGLLIGSMVCEMGGQVAWLATGIDFKFLKPVYIGETVTCTLTITEVDERRRARAEAVFTNAAQEEVLRAVMTGYVPGEAERQVLTQMVTEGDPTNKLG
jgi:acyl dehydratase